MSDEVWIALIGIGSTTLVGIAGLAFNFWNVSRERSSRLNERRQDQYEWYRRTLFERRVQAAQEAYSWVMKMNREISGASISDRTKPANLQLANTCVAAREWYDANASFLYDSLPTSTEFVGLINSAAEYSTGRGNVPDVWKTVISADQEVRRRLKDVLNAATTNYD